MFITAVTDVFIIIYFSDYSGRNESRIAVGRLSIQQMYVIQDMFIFLFTRLSPSKLQLNLSTITEIIFKFVQTSRLAVGQISFI